MKSSETGTEEAARESGSQVLKMVGLLIAVRVVSAKGTKRRGGKEEVVIID